MPRFAAPEWLILVAVLVFAAAYWKRPGLSRPLRFTCLLLLVLVLAEPRAARGGRGIDLWVLFDRSASARDLIDPRLEEMRSLLERSKSAGDRLFLVDYSDVPQLRGEAAGEVFAGSPHATATATAVRFALSRMASERSSRVLLVTDGYSTEPLDRLAETLVSQQVPLDYRLATRTTGRDYRAEALSGPARVQAGEPFLIEGRIAGTPDGDVAVELLRDGVRLGRTVAAVRGGAARIEFADRLPSGGAHRYSVRVDPAGDALPGNNDAGSWVEVMGGPRILLVTGYREDPVAAALRLQGFEVTVAEDPARLTPADLAGARAVFLDNVPAYGLSATFLSALDLFVRVQGGGLAMAGGRFSFGAGGYFGSAIDPLLPVSMELREEHRKLAVAMAIVMDRSGSMAAPIGAGSGTKMDLANEGAARSVDLLGANDAISVIAVDSEAHVVVPLTSVGANRASITDAVRRVQSAGGGIYVYTGLKAGWEQLKKSTLGQRHLILFADAADAEEPGGYQELLATMERQGITVSVIGLGSDADSDAAFLADVARRGHGRIFFNADPASLPAVFSQETVAVARSAFLTQPVGVKPTAGWLEIAQRPVEGLTTVDGYNLSYLRPQATAAAFSADEYAAPLIAFWNRGAGRVGAVSFPLGGERSDRVRAWSRYGDFLQTLGRWLMGKETPPGVGLRVRVEGSELVLDLLYDEEWESRLASRPPEALIGEGVSDRIESLVWEKIEPGRSQTRYALRPDRWYRGAVRVAGDVLPFGPVESSASAEWQEDPRRIRELASVSALSGGAERSDLASAWQPAGGKAPRDLRPWLLVAFVAVFLAAAAQTRFGWSGRPAARAALRAVRGIWPRRRRRGALAARPGSARSSEGRLDSQPEAAASMDSAGAPAAVTEAAAHAGDARATRDARNTRDVPGTPDSREMRGARDTRDAPLSRGAPLTPDAPDARGARSPDPRRESRFRRAKKPS